MFTSKSPLQQVLLSILRQDKGWQGLASSIDDADLFQEANRNQVDSMVAHIFCDAALLAEKGECWDKAHQQIHALISMYLDELDDVARNFADHDIPLVALKNGGIARGIFPCPGCCPMGDLDVLINRQHFRKAHHILLDQGFVLEFRSPLEKAELDAAEVSGGAEYYKILPNGERLWFELQWRPVAGRWIRPDQEPDADVLMERSISIPGTKVRLLAPEDNLLQVALHTAKHSYVRAPGFRLHFDVDRIVRAYPHLDWNHFTRQVEKLQIKTAVYFSLLIPKILFQTPIPTAIIERLTPAAWKKWILMRWIDWAGLFEPDAHKFSRPGYVLFTALLYDDVGGLWRSIFPTRAWMRDHFGFKNDLLLPYFYAKRLLDLAFRRRKT